MISWYEEIVPELNRARRSINLGNPEEIEKVNDEITKIHNILQSKNATREIMSREAQSLEGDLSADASTKVFEKLKLLHEAAAATEQQCRDLQSVLEKAQRASSKYAESKAQLMPWLEEVEGKLDDFENMDDGFRRDDSETPADELSHLSEEIAERRLLVDKIVNAGEKLGQMGGIEIKTEATQINERYQDCRERCRARKRELQQLAIEQQQFSERLSTLNVALQVIISTINLQF